MKREISGLVVASVVLVALLAPIPSLYSPSSLLGLSNPMTGIWGSIYSSKYPGHDTIRIPEMGNNGTVVIDNYGVPHIFTQSEKDLACIMGYLHAHDRLFQMDIQRRLVEGRLSEVLGSVTFDVDKLYRFLGLYRGATEIIEVMGNISQGLPVTYYPQLDVSIVSSEAAKLLDLAQAYCVGVNYAIQSMKAGNALPIEFKLLNYEPEPWTLENIFEMDRLMAWGLTGGFDDLDLYMIEQGLVARYGVSTGLDYLLDYFPIDRKIDHFIVPDDVNWSYPVSPDPPARITSLAASSTLNFKGLSEIIAWAREVDPMIAPYRGMTGSNDWVVGGNLTDTGKPIVCDDPHLGLSSPPVWYEVQYVAQVSGSETINARGVTLPGIGFIVIGSNQYVGWGFTNVMADQIDYYYYNWNIAGQYWYKGSWRDVVQVPMQIAVKTDQGVETRSYVLNFTVHGPVVERGGQRFAMCWLGERYGSTEGIALLKYVHAKNALDLLRATYYFQTPPQNHVFADIYGNFGYRAAGWYPNRTHPAGDMAIDPSDPITALTNRLPVNGSASDVVEWNLSNWIDANQAPTMYNPERGYVVTANNRHSNTSYPLRYDIAWSYADYYRAYRIEQLILQTVNDKGDISVDDMKRIQNDVYLVPASVLVPEIAKAFSGAGSTDAQAALAYFGSWNYTMLPDLVAPLIFVEWIPIIKNMTVADEFVDINRTIPGFSLTTTMLSSVVDSFPTAVLEALILKDPTNNWFNNVITGTPQNASTVMRNSFEKTIEVMKSKYGSDMSQWKFSVKHKLEIDHQLLSMFDYPHWSAWGWSDCVDNIASTGAHGPSWREIMSYANLNESLCIIPGGQSGSPFSAHYYDQLGMWLGGQYKPMSFPATRNDVTGEESILDFLAG